MSANYITSAELARRCNVSRAAVAIAIREHRIDPKKVRRAGNRVLVEEQHGFSVLGYHAGRKSNTSPSPGPAAVAPTPAADDMAALDLLAWGAAPILPDEPEVLTGSEEVSDLKRQVEMWSSLVNELENQLAWWQGAYADFREWITSKAAGSVLQKLNADEVVSHAVCDAIAAVQERLRGGLDEVHIQTTVQ
jgi:hypothetical protein